MSYRYKICFEFLGKDFFGSQKQPDRRTVQGEIEKALRTLIKENVNIIISGRLDAKVSAKHLTAHFDLNSKIENENKFLYSMNCILPHDIKIFELKIVNPNFHAQKSAKYKHYRYQILNDHVASVFEDKYLFYPYMKLDIKRINDSLSYLVGYHDFSAFKSHSDNPYNDCTIFYAKAKNEIMFNRNFVQIDIIGNRFLYNMIRTIVGLILYIERKQLPTSYMKNVMDTKDRRKAADVIDAIGLSLEYVGYDSPENYIKKLNSK